MTGWRPAPRTDTALAVIAAAEADRAERPERFRLDADTVAERAAGDRGSDDFVPGWREGLEAYLASAETDGRLNALGNRVVIETAVARLRTGSGLVRHRRENPDVGSSTSPPIVIVGGWRTGSTFLFRLLATDPRLRAPLPVELSAPLRVAGLTGAERERAIDAGAAAHDFLHAIAPELQAVHDSGARLAEECVLALGTDMRNWGFMSTTRLDSYARWLADQDLAAGYALYRHQLDALDDGSGRRWVLKAPAHTAELDTLIDTFPDAVVVHLHRDVVETVASGASLFATFRSAYSDEVDGADVGRFQTDQTLRWFDRALEVRRSPHASRARWVDVAYPDLVDDPATVLRRVWAAADLEAVDDSDGFVAAYRDTHPRHGHGVHRYRPEDFGIDDGEVRERFAHYVDFAQDVCGRRL